MLNKLILGTVQLGLKYGINNSSPKLKEKEVFEILNIAHDMNIRTLDTACAYGDSQEYIGRFIKSNKSKAFKLISKCLLSDNSKNSFFKKVEKTLGVLNVDLLEGYMIHDYNFFKDNKIVYDYIIEAKAKGLTKSIGISLYENKEIKDIIENFDGFDFIQIPFNLLDNESIRNDYLKKAQQKKIQVHSRSTFLQGLFFKNVNELPEKLLPLKKYLMAINIIAKNNQLNLEKLALQYALQKKYIDHVVIGCDNSNQLRKNIFYSKEKIKIPFNKIDEINVNTPELLNPKNWN